MKDQSKDVAKVRNSCLKKQDQLHEIAFFRIFAECASSVNYISFFIEWRSDKLWDHYVKWETTLENEKEIGTKNFSKVLALYDRILANPTQGLTHQFDMFKEFVKVHEPKGKKKYMP